MSLAECGTGQVQLNRNIWCVMVNKTAQTWLSAWKSCLESIEYNNTVPILQTYPFEEISLKDMPRPAW